MQPPDRPGHGSLVGQAAQDPAAVLIDMDGDIAAVPGPHGHLGGQVVPGRIGVFHRLARLCRKRGGKDGRRGQRAVPHGLDPFQVGMEPVVDFIVKQIGRAGQRQRDQERQHQQPGIEMPAPHRPIEVGCRGGPRQPVGRIGHWIFSRV